MFTWDTMGSLSHGNNLREVELAGCCLTASNADDSSNATKVHIIELASKMIRLGLALWSSPGCALRRVHKTSAAFYRLGPLVPLPAPGTVTIPIDAGGVRAERIITGTSHPDRHVIYLHGGGYLSGSPGVYRNVTCVAGRHVPSMRVMHRL